MAIWLIAVVAVAPCQCFSPGGHTTTSPAQISRLAPPQHCTQPQPEVTTNLWPSGWVCQAVRAPGSNVTSALETREASISVNSGSIRTLPVNHSTGPFAEGCEPLRLISIFCTSHYARLHRLAAIDDHGVPDDKGGRIRAQPDDGRGDLLGLTHSPDGLLRDHPLASLGRAPAEAVHHRGLDDAGAHGV